MYLFPFFYFFFAIALHSGVSMGTDVQMPRLECSDLPVCTLWGGLRVSHHALCWVVMAEVRAQSILLRDREGVSHHLFQIQLQYMHT